LVHKEHPATLIIAHLQALPSVMADDHDGIPGDFGKARPGRMRAFPLDIAGLIVDPGRRQGI
jgi:hypothetical protein